MRATYSSQLNLLDLVVLLDLIMGSLQIMKLSSVQFLQPAIFWGPNIFLRILFSHTLNVYF